MKEAEERGEEYIGEEEIEDGATKSYFFLLVMTIVLVTVVFLKVGLMIIGMFT